LNCIMINTVARTAFSCYPYVRLSRKPRVLVTTIVKNAEGWTDLLNLLLQRLN